MAMYDFTNHLLFLANGRSLNVPANLKRSNDGSSATLVKAWAESYGLIKRTDDFVTLL